MTPGALPQCFVVSTLVSMTPANAFIFRNYELSPDSAERARQVSQWPHSLPPGFLSSDRT